MNTTYSQDELKLMMAWAEAFVERGKITLQTSHNTTQLVAKLQGSLALPAEAPATKRSTEDEVPDEDDAED